MESLTREDIRLLVLATSYYEQGERASAMEKFAKRVQLTMGVQPGGKIRNLTDAEALRIQKQADDECQRITRAATLVRNKLYQMDDALGGPEPDPAPIALAVVDEPASAPDFELRLPHE